MKYRTIVADPPWEYRNTGTVNSWGTRTDAAGHYETMRDADICALPVADLAAENAHLYLWITGPRMFDAAPDRIAEAWGFKYKTLLTWTKTGQPGLGSYFRVCTEHILFCTRGKAPIPAALRERNHFTTPRTRHSSKPDAFYDLVERVSQGPYLELFARRARFGWDYWGDEALGQAELVSEREGEQSSQRTCLDVDARRSVEEATPERASRSETGFTKSDQSEVAA